MTIELTSAANLSLFTLAFFMASFVKGITGLGFSTTCLAILAIFVGVKTALPLIIVPSLVSNIVVMVDAGNFRPVVKRFWLLYVATIPGVIIGLFFLALVQPAILGAILGCVLIVYSIFALLQPNFRLPLWLEKPLLPITGFLTGVINGTSGSQVMPVLPFLISLHLSKDQFVQAINLSFSICTLIMIVGLNQLNLITIETMVISVVGVVPMLIGLKFGSTVRKVLSPNLFRIFVLCFLIFSGVILLSGLL